MFLSGGLDSSLVAAILARESEPGRPVHSFAAGTAESSDLAAARIVAEHLGLDHHERVYTADEVVDVLPTVVASIESFEPSLVRSAVPNYLLSELAAQHVKVVLTGEGADELFAGYDHLRDIADSDELRLELIRSVEGLHNLNLQRCDRVTMAHGLEARVPFLDLDLIAVAQRVPIEWKLPGEQGQEKAILREAFTGWIPDEILWRRKEQFGDGVRHRRRDGRAGGRPCARRRLGAGPGARPPAGPQPRGAGLSADVRRAGSRASARVASWAASPPPELLAQKMHGLATRRKQSGPILASWRCSLGVTYRRSPGHRSVVDAVTAALARIDATEPDLHALLHVDATGALATAGWHDRQRAQRGGLDRAARVA